VVFEGFLDFPPVEDGHSGVVEGGAERDGGAVQIAEYVGVGFELWGEGGAEGGESGCLDVVGVSGFVVDDPEGGVTFSAGLKAGAENAVDSDLMKIAANEACPARLACGVGVRAEDPLACRMIGGLDGDFKSCGSGGSGLSIGEAVGAELGYGARAGVFEGATCGVPIEHGAEACELFEKGMDCIAEGAGKQAAFVACVDFGCAEADDGLG